MQLKHIFNEHWTLINKTSHLESLAQKKTKTGVTNATVSAKANTSKHICSQSELLTWFSGVGYSAQHPHTCTHAHIQTHMVSLSPFWSRNENIKTHMNRAESKLLLWPRKKVQKNLLKLSRLKKKHIFSRMIPANSPNTHSTQQSLFICSEKSWSGEKHIKDDNTLSRNGSAWCGSPHFHFPPYIVINWFAIRLSASMCGVFYWAV